MPSLALSSRKARVLKWLSVIASASNKDGNRTQEQGLLFNAEAVLLPGLTAQSLVLFSCSVLKDSWNKLWEAKI